MSNQEATPSDFRVTYKNGSYRVHRKVSFLWLFTRWKKVYREAAPGIVNRRTLEFRTVLDALRTVANILEQEEIMDALKNYERHPTLGELEEVRNSGGELLPPKRFASPPPPPPK